MLVWFHYVLGHCGSRRLYDTINARFHIPKLREKCESIVCEECQRNKQIGPGYGDLPNREASLMPWNEVAVDLIGPWNLNVNGRKIEFIALTCIDPVTNIVELIRLNNKTARHVAEQFENVWLSRYPRPSYR